ncbi:MAG: hypothetical protein AVDCRST_MAG51-2894, partial [uncultured Ramlibacter sp.]
GCDEGVDGLVLRHADGRFCGGRVRRRRPPRGGRRVDPGRGPLRGGELVGPRPRCHAPAARRRGLPRRPGRAGRGGRLRAPARGQLAGGLPTAGQMGPGSRTRVEPGPVGRGREPGAPAPALPRHDPRRPGQLVRQRHHRRAPEYRPRPGAPGARREPRRRCHRLVVPRGLAGLGRALPAGRRSPRARRPALGTGRRLDGGPRARPPAARRGRLLVDAGAQARVRPL